MKKNKKKISKSFEKELLNLKITISEKSKKSEEAKEEFQEEEDNFREEALGNISPRFNFSSSSQRVSPVLEKSESPQEQATQNLEQEISQTPRIAAPEPVKEVIYVQNAPKYSSTDYSTRDFSIHDEENFAPRNIDIQTDITQGRTMNRSPVLTSSAEEQRISLGAWQRENVFRGDMQGASQQEREYQILGKKVLKEDKRLPFQ